MTETIQERLTKVRTELQTILADHADRHEDALGSIRAADNLLDDAISILDDEDSDLETEDDDSEE